MVQLGYTLSSEEHAPERLVANARRAEELGFDFASISDHYHPWVSAQGHSPFVWTVLGGIAARTGSISVGVGVSCPIVRLHPAVVAHAAATTALLFEGRFFLGLGTGEALNEHILGDRWPPPDVRREMLTEAIEILRGLWRGETFDFRGHHYTVENARLFDPPASPVPIVLSGFGRRAAELAATCGDGYWGTAPDAALTGAYEAAGGRGPRYAQLHLCWARDEATGRERVHRGWPNHGLEGQLAQDLPTWTHFEQATAVLTTDQTVGEIPCGPDIAGRVVESVERYVDAGYDHVYLHQIGPDQHGFFDFWARELRPELERRFRATPARRAS